jgi:CHAT domain-containing protein/tetratricopeptide (TPR) repeat protein
MLVAGLTALILIIAGQLAPGQSSLDYPTFARRAESLWVAGDRSGFDELVREHRAHLHRYSVMCEVAMIRSTWPVNRADGDRYERVARVAAEAFDVSFYLDRYRMITRLDPKEAWPALLRAWGGQPPRSDPLLCALVAVERARRAIEQVPPGPLPADMRRRIRRLRKVGCPDGALDGLLSVGKWHLLQGNLKSSAQALDAALVIDGRLGGARAVEIALSQGRNSLKGEDFIRARDRFLAALGRATGAQEVTARAHLAQAHAYLLDLDSAEAEAQRVEKELVSVPPSTRTIALIALAEVDARLGRFDRALEHNRAAERAVEQVEGGVSRRWLLVRRQRGYIHMMMGRFEQAESELRSGLEEAERRGDSLERIYHLRYLSDLAFRQGREGETLKWGLRMLEAARKARSLKETVAALRFLGKVHFRWRLLEDAALYLKEGLEIARRLGIQWWRREFVRDLLVVMDLQGRGEEAKHYESLLRQDLRQGQSISIARDLLLLARLARLRGDAGRAASDLEEALERLDRIPEASRDPAVDWLRGAAAIEASEQCAEVEEAVDYLEEAIGLARRIKDPRLEGSAITRMAGRLSTVGRLEEARTLLERAYRVGRKGLEYSGHLPLRAGYSAHSRDVVLTRLANVTLELERKGRAPDDAAFLLRLAEAHRDRRFGTEWAGYGGRADSEPFQKLRGQLEEVLSAFESSDRMEPAGRRALYERLTTIREAYRRLVNEAWQERPRIDPEELDVGALRTRLHDALLVEYVVGPELGFMITVGRSEGVRVFKLECDAHRLEGRVRYLDTFVQRLRVGHERDYARPAHTLFRDLLGPAVRAGLLPPGRPLVVVPDRALERLPFHALVTRPPAKAGTIVFGSLDYLIQRNPVRYLTAAGDLLTGGPEVATPRFLGVAPDPEQAGLPGAVREVETLRGLFPAGQAVLAVGDDAAESRLLGRADLSRHTIVHFATHGRASALDYSYSGLLLGRTDESGDDGVLHGYEIERRGIAPPLVVLSACSSGRDIADPGVTGVGWGRVFLEAGAASVVLSVWRVDDQLAVTQMSAFYRELLKGVPADRALAASARALIGSTDPSYAANPRYWAPFILVGHAIRFESAPSPRARQTTR